MKIRDVFEHISFLDDCILYHVVKQRFVCDREEFLFEFGDMNYRSMEIGYDYENDCLIVSVWSD